MEVKRLKHCPHTGRRRYLEGLITHARLTLDFLQTVSTVQTVCRLATPPNCLFRRAEDEFLSILTIHVSLETPYMLQLEARRKSVRILPITNLLSFPL